MKLIYLFIFFFINIITNTVYGQNIVVVNIQFIIDNNQNYIDTVKQIDINQQKYFENFEKREKNLQKISKNIEETKLILNENEINKKIDDYNNQLANLKIDIEEFNIHYQQQIINIREIILKEIIILLENYAIKNSIDLILDSTSYLIASNSIDITEIINNKLKNINIKLEYEDFEKN